MVGPENTALPSTRNASSPPWLHVEVESMETRLAALISAPACLEEQV